MGVPSNFQFVDRSLSFKDGNCPFEIDLGESKAVGHAENVGLGNDNPIENLSSGCIRQWLIGGRATILDFCKQPFGENALWGS
jgi:hypothetical protein